MKNVVNKSFISHSEQETFLFAEELDKFPLGTIFLLKGDLGSGKTTLVKGFAKHLGIKDKVQSPTFNIMKLYLDGKVPLVHIDAYRLEDNNVDIGLGEYIGIEKGYTMIEWPQFIDNLIDKDKAVIINLTLLKDNERQIDIKYGK